MSKIYDIAIIGAGVAGMTAAIYARRAGKSVLILESKVVGGQIVNAIDVRNWPGESRISGTVLTERIYSQMSSFNVDFHYDPLDKIQKDGETFKLVTSGTTYSAKSIIIATGTRDRQMNLPREAALTGYGVSYCATCDGELFFGQDIAVIGGGNTAFYDVLYLANLARRVYLVHRRAEFRADQVLVDQAQKLENVEFLLGYTPKQIIGENLVEGLVVQKDGKQKTLPVEAIFVAIGRDPNTEQFKGLVDLDQDGYIIAADAGKTSTPGIFAAGDCRTKSLRQLITAAGDGASAAMSAVAYLQN